MPVIHTTNIYGEEFGIQSWAKRSVGAASDKGNFDDNADDKRPYEIIVELKHLPGETLIHKSSTSAFWGTPLLRQLNSLGLDTIITAGESTSGCVRATVVDGCNNGYRMIVVEECVFDRTEASHAINLFDMNEKYSDVVSLSDVIQSLHKWHERVK